MKHALTAVLLLGGVIASAQNPRDLQKANSKSIRVSVCQLLDAPSKFNNHLVTVRAWVKSDFEHFDIRGDCEGYVSLQNSIYEADVEKFGFKTRDNTDYKQLILLLNETVDGQPWLQPNCIECSPRKNKVTATVTGLFRCHYDFSNCDGVSRFGDGSIVIRSVTDVSAVPLQR
jgi:hypothetical protein